MAVSSASITQLDWLKQVAPGALRQDIRILKTAGLHVVICSTSTMHMILSSSFALTLDKAKDYAAKKFNEFSQSPLAQDCAVCYDPLVYKLDRPLMTIFPDQTSGKWYPAMLTSERIEIIRYAHFSDSAPLHTTSIQEDMEVTQQDLGGDPGIAITNSQKLAREWSCGCLPNLGFTYYHQFYNTSGAGSA